MKLYEKARVLDYTLSLIFSLYSKCKQHQRIMTDISNDFIVQLKPTLKKKSVSSTSQQVAFQHKCFNISRVAFQILHG